LYQEIPPQADSQIEAGDSHHLIGDTHITCNNQGREEQQQIMLGAS
jgi:hypothetical protein